MDCCTIPAAGQPASTKNSRALIPHVSTVSGDDGKTYGLPSNSAPRSFNVTNEAEKVLQWLRHRGQAWPDDHRPELAKTIKQFAGEIMAGGEFPHVNSEGPE